VGRKNLHPTDDKVENKFIEAQFVPVFELAPRPRRGPANETKQTMVPMAKKKQKRKTRTQRASARPVDVKVPQTPPGQKTEPQV